MQGFVNTLEWVAIEPSHRATREFGIPVSVKAGNSEAVSKQITMSNFLGSENKNISGVILIKTFEPHKLLNTFE